MRSLILVVLVSSAALAQDKPDFSGRWTLVEPARADDIASVLVVRQTVTRTNVRGEPMTPYFKEISIEREFASGRRSETHAIGIVSGFVSGTPAGPAGPRTHYGVTWDSNALVFEHASYTGEARATGVWSERREVWSLDPDGRLRATITTRGSADVAGTTTNLMYRRQ
jgi:hypothetical protein